MNLFKSRRDHQIIKIVLHRGLRYDIEQQQQQLQSETKGWKEATGKKFLILCVLRKRKKEKVVNFY